MNETNQVLNKAIDDSTEEIIKLVDEFAKENSAKIVGTHDKKKDGKAGKRQFTDLVEAAGQTCCINEFKLYIEYKGSKKGTSNLWDGLAKPFNKKIDDLMVVADKIIKSVRAENEDIEDERVKIEVLKRFCGYLMWRTHADISMEGGR